MKNRLKIGEIYEISLNSFMKKHGTSVPVYRVRTYSITDNMVKFFFSFSSNRFEFENDRKEIGLYVGRCEECDIFLLSEGLWGSYKMEEYFSFKDLSV